MNSVNTYTAKGCAVYALGQAWGRWTALFYRDHVFVAGLPAEFLNVSICRSRAWAGRT